ncbi:MBL fold metallo-hydrolase [Bacteroides sp. 214]|uniref:MBL fold metallo-hydrolase n=1 Tax=Bacteroides sp. 214 TaxID=2302935 RepID=UPI0013D3E627|nr:MBL fold metallo-hydrolase [Bacteroides sp. 214]NDW12498.1 MBL fold metallo-hydrolase [Bacteroides sp. 214]
MKITYIYHSGFAIETESCIVLIDYYKDTDTLHGYVHEQLLRCKKPLYILASHFHPDHFNREVLTWKEEKPNITYIFSKDILKHKRAKKEDGIFIQKGDVYSDEMVKIEAFGSTDIGVSFLIYLEGKSIFHAGDLNNWHWKDESTPEEIVAAETAFLKELEIIAKVAPQIDLVMFPIDARIGTDYMRGAEQFVDRIRTGVFLPMHFGSAYEEANAFKIYAESKNVHFIDIIHTEQIINTQ